MYFMSVLLSFKNENINEVFKNDQDSKIIRSLKFHKFLENNN